MKITLPLLAALTLVTQADDLDFGVAKAQWLSYGDLDSSDGAEDLQWQQWRMQTPFSKPQKLADSLYMMPAIRYELINFEGPSLGIGSFDDDLHMIELPLLFVYKNAQSPWSYNARVSPGISSDMQSVSMDDVFCDARLGASYQVNERLNINFGVAYTRAIGEPQVFPYLGFVYEVNDQWQIAWRGFSFEARCQLNESWILRMTGEAAGGYWNINTPESDYLTLQSYRAGFSIEREIRDEMWLVAGAGYTLGNEVTWLNDTGDTLRRERYDDGYYFTFGLRLRDW
jgi:hypothetical protein